MVLEKTYPAGAEEWYCPTCGRRMIITWKPWKKIILEPGDSYAVHSGGKGGLGMGPFRFTPADDRRDPSAAPDLAPDRAGAGAGDVEAERLAPWLAWLEEIDFDNLWNGEVE
jgi:hypothetical protein